MELFEQLSVFLKDKSEMIFLVTTDDKVYLSYLADIFEKLCSSNKQLQGAKYNTLRRKSKTIRICDISQIVQKQYFVKKLCPISFVKRMRCHSRGKYNYC